MGNEIEGKKEEFVTKFRSFLQKNYQKDIAKASEKNIALNIDFCILDKFSPDLGNVLLNNPESLMEIANDSLKAEQPDFKNKIRFSNIPSPILVRNIRTKQAGKFISIEGIVKKASEIRPEIMQGVWECKDCLQIFTQPRKGAFIFEPTKCPMPGCGSKELTQKESDKVDVRWLTIEEPFELTEGDKPSQIMVYLTEDLISPLDRHLSDVGNRLKITGILREIPKGKLTSVRLDFYLDANHIEPVDISWERVEVTKEDAEKIRELAKDDKIYDIFVESLAPSIYGLSELKESIMMQIFGGVQRTLKDKIKFRGDIHILIIGDPSLAKSQILKLVPEIVPRGRYVSGKGATSAGLTASVTKDEFFGWTLEAGAVVLANKGLLSVDEFEKMSVEDQVAFHEAMESGCYDDKTEILTDKGWKYFKELIKTDLIATLSEKGIFEYQKPIQYIQFPYNGDMYRIKSLRINLLVTPNHNMFVNIYKRADKWNGFKLQRVDSLPDKKIKFKKDAIWNGKENDFFVLPSIIKKLNQFNNITTNEREYPMNDWLEFLGYFLSEGCIQHHYKTKVPYRIYISQTKNKDKIEKIRASIEKLNLKYSFDGHNFSISDKQLATYLSPIGKQTIRYIPREYMDLPPHQLMILLDAMILGDGLITKRMGKTICGYVTSSERLANDVQELSLKAGYSATIHKRVVKENAIIRGREINSKGHVIYNLTICGYKSKLNTNEPTINSNGLKHITQEHYDGNVYCVEVPNHVIYVRRNGYPVWCGNSVSIAKASIVTTLPARTSILAGGNPKMGRFDPFIAIAKQINIPETLMSRFDLKFALQDKPNSELDANTVDHILKSRNGDADVLPKLSPEFIRKYVAYAKENCKPEFSPETSKVLKDFYIKMRKRAEGVKAVPITLRQFEAMLRLAEASAKVQLSPIVRPKDSERAIRLMTFSLKQLGLDPETQEIDVDRAEGGIPASERGRIRKLMKIIQAKFYDTKEINIRELKEEAEKLGMHEIDDAIDQLLRNGEYYKPSPGILSKV